MKVESLEKYDLLHEIFFPPPLPLIGPGSKLMAFVNFLILLGYLFF